MSVYTVAWPLDVDSGEELYKTLSEDDIRSVVKFNVKSTIFTCPGERRSAPSFGACIKKYLFELAGEELFEQMHASISSQLRTYVPYCRINDLSISYSDESPNEIRIFLRYVIAEVNIQDTLEIMLPSSAVL